ncbi:MAG: YdcF family protein [Gemmatimonadota bacterium]|nr:YdcF family protein [Gemmatimonadota bacterium]
MKVIRIFAALAVALVAGWLLVLAAIYFYGRRDDAARADAVVVLGAAQYDGRPSPVLRARLDHAIRLYHDGIAPRLITTGGVGPGDTVSEAVVGRRYAIRNGVPADAILTERSGLGTTESVAAVAQLMREGEMQSAVLVSDPFHMLRLRLLAARFGIRAHSSPTRTSPISRKSDEEWRHVLRESLVLPFALVERP